MKVSAALYVARAEARHLLVGREALLWTFVMPILFFWFIGTVTAGFATTHAGLPQTALRVDASADAGFLAERLKQKLEDAGFRLDVPDATSRLSLPPRFTDHVLAGERTVVTWDPDGEGHTADYDRVRLQRVLYTLLADVIVAGKGEGKPDARDLVRLDEAPRPLVVDTRSAGRRPNPPTGFEQSVPGILVMFTLMVLLTSGGVLLVVERRRGLLRRLASAPILRGEIVAGKWAGRLVLGLVQVGFAILAGTFLFGMAWGPDFPAVLVVLLAWAAFCASCGLWVGTLAHTEGQAVALGVLFANVLAALGGCWWPIEITPPWMQRLASLLPTGWAMDAMHRLVVFRLGFWSSVGDLALLVGGALVIGWLSAKRFRFS